MTSPSLSALLHLHGLPPLPRSLTGYATQGQGSPNFGSSIPSQPHLQLRNDLLSSSSALKNPHSAHLHQQHGRPSPPVPPPRPHSRRSSSSGSSFRASPDHVSNRSVITGIAAEGMRSSPRSLSSSPHSPHIDSGIGRSSADSFSEPRAFVRVVKSPPIVVGTRLDAQLAQLKKDMNHLRQQDMALLGHLLHLHQGIQDLKSVLVPPPQPAPISGPLPMFHSTPTGYHHHGGGGSGSTSSSSRNSKNSKGHHQSTQSSRLSILSTGAKLFSRRSSTDKLMAEAMSMSLDLGGACGGGPSTHHTAVNRRRLDDESDSLSSLEFGDV